MKIFRDELHVDGRKPVYRLLETRTCKETRVLLTLVLHLLSTLCRACVPRVSAGALPCIARYHLTSSRHGIVGHDWQH